MCGRYRLSRRKQILEEHFLAQFDELEDWTPHYNIAPTQLVPVIRQHPKEPVRVLSLLRWGLVPSWSRDSSGAARMINARSETVNTMPAFREAFRLRRCLIPTDGFYEWKKNGQSKQPYCFEVNNGELFAFAGLWDRWKNPAGEWMRTCSILTTTPNAVAAKVHDRMPVILEKENYDVWLDPGLHNTADLSELLKPFDANRMRDYAVNTRINSVANDDEAAARPVSNTNEQESLFEQSRD